MFICVGVTTVPDRNNLREDTFVLAHVFRDFSPSYPMGCVVEANQEAEVMTHMGAGCNLQMPTFSDLLHPVEFPPCNGSTASPQMVPLDGE